VTDSHPVGNPNALVGSPAAAQARAIFEQQRPATGVVGTADSDDDDDFEETVDVNTFHNEGTG